MYPKDLMLQCQCGCSLLWVWNLIDPNDPTWGAENYYHWGPTGKYQRFRHLWRYVTGKDDQALWLHSYSFDEHQAKELKEWLENYLADVLTHSLHNS